MLSPVRVYLLRNEIEVFHKLWENRHDIVSPISGTIANNKALQIHMHAIIFWESVPHIVLFIVLVDLPSQVWSVNATIAFTRNEESVVVSGTTITKLWELLEKFLECSIGIFRLNHVIIVHVLLLCSP